MLNKYTFFLFLMLLVSVQVFCIVLASLSHCDITHQFMGCCLNCPYYDKRVGLTVGARLLTWLAQHSLRSTVIMLMQLFMMKTKCTHQKY